jgi:hypothetical protein
MREAAETVIDRNRHTALPSMSSEPTSGAFFSAYVSLILIVLTFILAFFFKPSAFLKESSAPVLKLESLPISQEIEISNPFSPEGTELIEEEWSGVVFALKNHDLDSEIVIRRASDGEALGLSQVVQRSLIKMGVPGSAFKVYGAGWNTDEASAPKTGSRDGSQSSPIESGVKTNKVLIKFYAAQK